MREITNRRWLRFLTFLSAISLNFMAAYSDHSTTPNNGTKSDDHSHSDGGNGPTVAIVCLVIVAISLLSFFLFKYWQKKNREEQYARLLKLFEEDDELELELGLRD